MSEIATLSTFAPPEGSGARSLRTLLSRSGSPDRRDRRPARYRRPRFGTLEDDHHIRAPLRFSCDAESTLRAAGGLRRRRLEARRPSFRPGPKRVRSAAFEGLSPLPLDRLYTLRRQSGDEPAGRRLRPRFREFSSTTFGKRYRAPPEKRPDAKTGRADARLWLSLHLR